MAKTLYIIAGEASGDVIGGELIGALQQQRGDIVLHGIGGPKLTAHGLSSLFDMHDIALMGFAEVLPHARRLKRRIAQTIADIKEKKPDLLITIDSPGFTFRVVQALREHGFETPCVHYVAPTVWAYKPHRAQKTMGLFHALLCILPFESPYFQPHRHLPPASPETQEAFKNLPPYCFEAHYVGHPIAWLHKERGDGAAFRAGNNIAPNAIVLGMMPGSRRGELKRHLPIFQQTAQQLAKHLPCLHIVMPTNPDVRAQVQAYTDHWPVPVTLSQPEQKSDALAACDIALAKSGTIALECALAGLPLVTCFKTSWLSAAIVKRFIRIPYVNLINIMAHFEGKPAPIAELLQGDCKAEKLSAALLRLHEDASLRQAQIAASTAYCEQLGMYEQTSPSEKAAALLIREYLN